MIVSCVEAKLQSPVVRPEKPNGRRTAILRAAQLGEREWYSRRFLLLLLDVRINRRQGLTNRECSFVLFAGYI